MSRLWYIYLIRTQANALYCGITTDVDRRFDQHSRGQGAKALKGRGPLTLEWSVELTDSRSEALKIEYAIKQLSKAQKEQLVTGQVTLSCLGLI